MATLGTWHKAGQLELLVIQPELIMGNVNESIWSNEFRIIPLAEVSHIEKHKDTNGSKKRILIIFKHSSFNNESNDYEPSVYLDDLSGSDSFIRAWRMYRHELDSVNLIDEGV